MLVSETTSEVLDAAISCFNDIVDDTFAEHHKIDVMIDFSSIDMAVIALKEYDVRIRNSTTDLSAAYALHNTVYF